VELHMLEAKSVRLTQSFEDASSETAQDALVATQMAITSKRPALKNIRAAVEANRNNLMKTCSYTSHTQMTRRPQEARESKPPLKGCGADQAALYFFQFF